MSEPRANRDRLQRVVGPDVPPTDHAGRWERGKSPWHADAFPNELKQFAPEHGDRETGWLEIDWYGNFIGWVPDGCAVQEHPTKRMFRTDDATQPNSHMSGRKP